MKINREQVGKIVKSVKACRLCDGLDKSGALCISEKEIGLGYMTPVEGPIKILFLAESPPRAGHGFFYDEKSMNTTFRRKIFELINLAGLGQVSNLLDFNGKSYYLADSINCRWDKDKKAALSKKIFRNCSIYLEDQLRLLRPQWIVAMGRKAKEALEFENIESTIRELGTANNIISFSFPLGVGRYMTEKDEDRVGKMRRICL